MLWFNFFPWCKFYFPVFWGEVIYDNVFKTKENKILIKNKIEPQHIQSIFNYQPEMFFKWCIYCKSLCKYPVSSCKVRTTIG